MQSEDMAQAPAHLNEKRKERRVLHSHTIAHNCTHTHETGTSLSSSNGRGVNNLWNFSLGSWPLFCTIFSLWLSVMESQNVGRKSFAISVLRRALIWFEISIWRGPVGNTVLWTVRALYFFFFLRLSNGFSWRPFQFAICVFYYWIFLKPILGLSLGDMVLTG